jgi:hypothetical protein
MRSLMPAPLPCPAALQDLAREFGAMEVGTITSACSTGCGAWWGEALCPWRAIDRGAQDPLDISAGLCRVAEAAIDALARATIAEFEATHGRIPGGELVILGLGRLGGGMLTHASDLDLVYLFTGDFAAEATGAALLAQRSISTVWPSGFRPRCPCPRRRARSMRWTPAYAHRAHRDRWPSVSTALPDTNARRRGRGNIWP